MAGKAKTGSPRKFWGVIHWGSPQKRNLGNPLFGDNH
jgi:hypothetical protein